MEDSAPLGKVQLCEYENQTLGIGDFRVALILPLFQSES